MKNYYASAAKGMGSILVSQCATSLNAVVLSVQIFLAIIKKGNNISVKDNHRAFQDQLILCKFSLIA